MVSCVYMFMTLIDFRGFIVLCLRFVARCRELDGSTTSCLMKALTLFSW